MDCNFMYQCMQKTYTIPEEWKIIVAVNVLITSYHFRDFVTSTTESLSVEQIITQDDADEIRAKLNALFVTVDTLQDGSDEDKRNALTLLQDKEMEVQLLKHTF